MPFEATSEAAGFHLEIVLLIENKMQQSSHSWVDSGLCPQCNKVCARWFLSSGPGCTFCAELRSAYNYVQACEDRFATAARLATPARCRHCLQLRGVVVDGFCHACLAE